MSVETLATVEANLAAQGALRAVHEDDVIAGFLAMMAAGGIELRTSGASAAATIQISGSSWQGLESSGSVSMWSTGDPVPNAGGKGLLPSVSGGSLTVETGGDGWYLVLYHIDITATHLSEFAVERQREAVKARGVNSRCIAAELDCAAGFFFVNTLAGDVLRIVGRTGAGNTCDADVWSGQFLAIRVLPT